jgi:two-component system sensor histidine kinase KdpD
LRIREESLRNSLLAAISHDVRTPLTGIVGAASSLLTQQHSPQAQHELLHGIHDEALAMNELASNLLDMARLQAGPVQLRCEWQPIEEVIGSALAREEKRLQAHPLEVVLKAPLPLVYIDSALMERVLVNLLENAVKYTPPGTHLHLIAEADVQHLRLILDDEGPGLPAPPETLFGKFVRGAKESPTTGVGLGLSLGRAIVEAHGGRLDAEAHPGGGARFIILLPRGEPPAPPPEA